METRQPARVAIPTVDLTDDTSRQVVVDREAGQYLGHPTTVLLEDGKTLLAVYPKGHGRGAIQYKRSVDGGLSWSGRLPVPPNWSTSQEVPTLYRTVDPSGRKRLVLFSGLYPIRMAHSEDDGATWSELQPIGDYGGIVAMASCVRLADGRYAAWFHDDGRYFRRDGRATGTFTLYQVTSADGGMTWSTPRAIESASEIHLCEPGVIRSPDGKQLAMLLRENRRRRNSYVMFSNDEGATWTEPRELPAALTGDRHAGKYAPDGRLLLSFRDTARDTRTAGDWVAWVGRYEDIAHGRDGQYRIRLKDNIDSWDCAYPGVEILPGGTFVLTTYGHWTEGEPPYILSVRLRLDETDRLSAAARGTRVIRVGDFGARGDGVADDGPAFRAALATAQRAIGPVRVEFEPRTYRIGPWDGHWYSMLLKGARDITLEGNGAALLVHPQNRVLFLDACTNVTFRGFVLDYSPLPCTQGDVLEVHPAEGWFALRLHAGYPDLPTQEWVEANGPASDWRHGVFVDGPRGKFTHAWVPVERVETTATARTYRIHPPAGWQDSLARVQPGHCFAMRVLYHTREFKAKLFATATDKGTEGVYLNGGPLSNVRLAHCTDCTIEQVRQDMAPDMGFHLFDTAGTRLSRVTIDRKPGTDRIMAGMSDGMHCKTNRSGPTIEHCHFAALGDDSINIAIHPEVAMEVRSDREVVTAYSDIAWFDTPLRVGDTLTGFDPVSGAILGEARVARLAPLGNQRRAVTLESDMPGMQSAAKAGYESATQLYRISTGRFAIRDCRFESQLKTAMLARGAGVVERCHVQDCAYGVTSHNSPEWREGPWPNDLAIRGCTFRNVWIDAVTILAIARAISHPIGKQVSVERCVIEQRDGNGIHLTNLAQAAISRCRVTMAPGTPAQYLAIHLLNCGDVRISDTVVQEPRAGAPGAVVSDGMPQAALHIEGLRATTAPGVTPVARRGS